MLIIIASKCVSTVQVLLIEMICFTDKKGNIKPIRFRMQIGDEPFKVIKIKVTEQSTLKLAGNTFLVFKCQSIIDDSKKIFETKYVIETCKWILYKM